MSERQKVAILGGSSAFTPALAVALAKRRVELANLDVVLIGRDPGRTRIVAGACQSLAGATGADHRYSASTALSAVAGARVVLNQMRVGGWAGRQHDERFPLEWGLPGDETIGPGGLASALRSAQPVLEAARATREHAPEAVFLNLTNPMGILLAVLRKAGLPALGLCELPADTLRRAAAECAAQRGERWSLGELEPTYVGLNHQGWFLRIEREGVDVLPEILSTLATRGAPGFFRIAGRTMAEQRALALPYMRFYYQRDSEVSALRAAPRSRGEELSALTSSLYEHYASTELREPPAELATREMPWIHDAVVPALIALLGGEAQVLYISEQNRGHLPLVPDEAIVEKRARLGCDGAVALPQALDLGDARTAGFLHFLSRIAGFEEAAAEAALAEEAQREARAAEALMQHPFEIDPETAERLARAALAPLETL